MTMYGRADQTVEQSKRRERFLDAVHLQEIEDNPFTRDEIEMFEMFLREGWSGDQCRAYISQNLRKSK